MSAIAIIVGSTRQLRLCPAIAQYVQDIATSYIKRKDSNIQIDIVDLAAQNLPLYDEPAIPSHLSASNPTPEYAHEHTRAWSAKIRRYDGFIFVTPQYNWSIPASLKNALDYLFHEWSGKPGSIVTYGAKGGIKAADHLRSILTGLRMKPVSTDVALRITETLLESHLRNGGLEPAVLEQWREAGAEERLEKALNEVVEILED